jgi:hypothetical protein
MFLFSLPAFLLFLVFHVLSHRRHQPWGWRASVMMTSVAWGSLVVAANC